MRKWIILFIMLLALWEVNALEFKVDSCELDVNDLHNASGRVTDGEKQACAVLRVETDVKPELYLSGAKIVKKENIAPGQYYFFISAKDTYITFGAEGYTTYTYKIPIILEQGRTYKLLLSSVDENFKEGLAVMLKTNPDSAEIYINNKAAGLSGKPIRLKKGINALKIVKKGYESMEQSLNIDEFNTYFEFNLETTDYKEAGGYLNLTVQPSDATILIDNKDFTGKTHISLLPDYYSIKIYKAGFDTLSDKFGIQAGEKLDKNYVLTGRNGKLQFAVNPSNTAVIMRKNGILYRKWIGLSYIKDIPFGTYVLEAKLSGYATQKDTIVIKDNKTIIRKIIMEKGADIPERMVHLEGGNFNMGRNSLYEENDKAKHEELVLGFWIGRYEVTQREWMEVMGTNPSNTMGDDLPVTNVKWLDALSYCNKKSLDDGLNPCYIIDGNRVKCDFQADGYRLPTEAEWEYAARSGPWDHSGNFSGNDEADEVCWYIDNTKEIKPVGQKKPNTAGIYDMSGNVWEYCWDRKIELDKKNRVLKVDETSQEPYNIWLRGGSAYTEKNWCKVVRRKYQMCIYGGHDVGFRICKTAL